MIKEFLLMTPSRIYPIWVRNPREKVFTQIPAYEHRARNVGKMFSCQKRLQRWAGL